MIKGANTKWSLTFCQELSSSVDSHTWNQTVQYPLLRKGFDTKEHTGNDHLHFAKSCHHQPFALCSPKQFSVPVVYHMRISYRTCMVYTVRVYAYGTTVRVWYGYLYHMRIAVLYYYCLQATCI